MKPSDRRSRLWRSLIQQASRLNLGTSHLNSGVGTKSRKPEDQMSCVGAQSGFLSDHGGDTSGAIKSTDDFASIGYSYEHSDLESHPFTPPPELTLSPLVFLTNWIVQGRRRWLG